VGGGQKHNSYAMDLEHDPNLNFNFWINRKGKEWKSSANARPDDLKAETNSKD
jgi:hypothetical protein